MAASDQDDALASFSNYGANSVDVAAPGTNILSTYPENQYAYLQGTSMATPNVVGTVALLATAYPNSTVAERKAMILDHVEKKSVFDGKMTTSGRVNVNNALANEEKNVAPTAQDDSATTAYETAVTIDVLRNDSDEDGDTLSISSTSIASHGSVSISDGKIVYTPADGYEGDDTFSYTISDGKSESTANVTVTVNAQKEDLNVAPVAKDDTATTAYETVVHIDVLANDSDENGDSLSITSTSTPANGSVAIELGSITYTPNDNFEGEDSFEYTISDGAVESTAKIIVTVEEKPNTTPTANDDSAIANYNESVTIAILENDSDEDEDALSIASYTQASNGTVSQDRDKLVYTANSNYSGDDSFTYTITDGEATDTATVNVTVKEESKTIQLPIIGGNLGQNNSSEQWEELDFRSHDIDYTTKDGNGVSIGLNQDNQLVSSIQVNGKETKVTIDIPDTTMKVDSNGETLIEFKGKELKILIGKDGSITPTLPAAVLPKTELPVGTGLTVSGDLMKFVVPLSNEIKF